MSLSPTPRNGRRHAVLAVALCIGGCGGREPEAEVEVELDVEPEVEVEFDVAPEVEVESESEVGVVPVCDAPRHAAPRYHQAVGHVVAHLVDQDGLPVAGVSATVCGLDSCLAGTKSDALGRVAIDGHGSVLENPAFKCGDGVAFARTATPLHSADANWSALLVPRLGAPGDPLLAGTTARADEVTLTLAPDAVVKMPLLVPEDSPLRSARVPLGVPMPLREPALGLDVFVAVGPTDARLCPPAALRVPNVAAWPPGSPVEIYLHGASGFEEAAPYGGWERVSHGTVDADGLAITTAPDDGLPMLGLLGLRRASAP